MNILDDLARGYFAQLSPLTGTRAGGTVTAKATGPDVVVPRNSYLLPLIKGSLLYQWPFKVAANPATAEPHNQGGEWTVTSAGTQIALVANTGGAQRNLEVGTELVWDPPIAGLEPKVTVDAKFTGGTAGMVKGVAFFEDLSTAQQQADIYDARIGAFPAFMLVWFRTVPLEGRTSGASRGDSRKKAGQVVNFEHFTLYIVTSRKDPDPRRRREGFDLMVAASDALTDMKRNDDGELMASQGSVEVLERARFARGPEAYIYAIALRSAIALCRTDSRTFAPWLRTRYVDILEADPPLAEGQKIDVTFGMT